MSESVDISMLSIDSEYAERILADEKRAVATETDEAGCNYGLLYLSKHKTLELIGKMPKLEQHGSNYKIWKDQVDKMMLMNIAFQYITIPSYISEHDPMEQGIKGDLEDAFHGKLLECITNKELSKDFLKLSSVEILVKLDRTYA